MATKKTTAPGKRRAENKGPPARTDSTSARGARRGGDARQQQAADTQAVSAAMAFNENKAAEHGRAAATQPPVGLSVDAPPNVGASTLTEGNVSDKTGAPAEPGTNRAVAPLGRLRADGAGAVLTTNQGVAVADNQNSLPSGSLP